MNGIEMLDVSYCCSFIFITLFSCDVLRIEGFKYLALAHYPNVMIITFILYTNGM